MKNMIRTLTATLAAVGIIGLTTISVKPAAAAPTFLGSFVVGNGPDWHLNPAVYSGQEAAALLFGGLPSDYLISVNSSLDPTTITDTAHYDGWGETDTVFAQDFHFDQGAPGYNDPGGLGSAWSAYVHDHEDGNVNYVWLNDARVAPPCDNAPVTPEPTSLSLLMIGGTSIVGLVRRKLLI